MVKKQPVSSEAGALKESQTKEEEKTPRAGLTIPRYFTQPGVSPYDAVTWELRDATIGNDKGELVFEQKGVEVPASWSQLATNIAASKYFHGHMGTSKRERSIRQLVGRVVDTIKEWGIKGNYFKTAADADIFADELAHLLLTQKAAFNSPVWFNVGIEPHPQGSACFINSVSDTMPSILDLAKTEGMLFKYGSGTGTNFSSIRSSKERLSTGGIASGPVSFMRGFDAFAGVIKSGGRTRRAAKMVILNIDHPDVEEFITCKAREEQKAWTLIDAGYDGSLTGDAYSSIFFQNANHSVRVSDAFMQAAENDGEWYTRAVTTGQPMDRYRAHDLLRMIAESAHVCGDPGMQYDDTINRWHTCKNTARINASNPCCVTGDTLIAVADGRNAVPIKDLVGTEVPVYAHDHTTGRTTISRMWNIGIKREHAAVYRVTLDDGSSFRATDDHLIMLRDGAYRMVRDLQPGDSLMPFHSKVLAPAETRTKRRYYWTGHSWQPQYRAVWSHVNGAQPQGFHIHHRDLDALNDAVTNLVPMPAEEHQALHAERMRGDNNPARRGMSDTWRQNISKALRGERNGNYGRTHSGETRRLMREKSAQRWASPDERARSGASIKAALAKAKAEGRRVGRPRGERYERCCPACRTNFTTPHVEQVFCSKRCRYSPLGIQMSGEKTWAHNRGHSLSVVHRARLSASVRAASDPETKRRAARVSHHNTILKTARLLLDNNMAVSLQDWDSLRAQARALGVEHVPSAAVVAQHFADNTALLEQAALYNHKVVSVEFCGYEDVYDGTVDTHHNFAVLTSAEPSCASGAQNYSGLFIHNSEYMFLDDTACNLASLNLMKFARADGGFDVEAFRAACATVITAQEIIVDNASYPTPRIAENSHNYRPLGLGYANLGALLMFNGIPYDSDKGRDFAAAITAVMTGQAYLRSAEIARELGPFPGYEKNREPMLGVIAMHRSAVKAIDPDNASGDLYQAAWEVWDQALELGKQYGYKNAQASVLAPTGTIGLLMDCDTTGVEPDLALVKYKKLVGGGLMRIVNNTVPAALQRLGYTPEQTDEIVTYIDQNGTIEGAPHVQSKDLPVFDCAFKAPNGVRAIHYMGHVKMMAAVQPFLSGAISKTVNMPNESNVEEIMQTYVAGWKMGLKAIAIYRDGSKRTQPLNSAGARAKKGEAEAAAKPAPEAAPEKVVYKPVRHKLPSERRSITHKFSVGGHEGYITVGMFDDGTPGEIFLVMAKEGSTISGLMDAFATAISMALQYGVPIKALIDKFSHMRFEPSGFTGNPEIPMAKSIMDYVFRWLALKFLPPEERARVGLVTPEGLSVPPSPSSTPAAPDEAPADNPALYQTDAPSCSDCGAIMVRNGTCYKCVNCGETSGCS